MKPHNTPRLIRNPKTLKALSSAISQEIIDTLESAGVELSVAELAQQLGKHPDGLYYHVRRLRGAGLIVESGPAGEARRYRTAAPIGVRLRLLYPRSRDSDTQPVSNVVRNLLRMAQRDFEKGLKSGSAVVAGPLRDLWAGRVKGWVSGAELGEINQLIERLQSLLHKPRSEVRNKLLAASWVLTPVVGQSGRRLPRSTR
jgi:DNA-binding transcriptional ArsR family regulator